MHWGFEPSPRPRLSGDFYIYTGEGGGGQRPRKELMYLKSTSNLGPFDRFHSFLLQTFSDVGGWVGQAEEPRPPFAPSLVTLNRGLTSRIKSPGPCATTTPWRIHSGGLGGPMAKSGGGGRGEWKCPWPPTFRAPLCRLRSYNSCVTLCLGTSGRVGGNTQGHPLLRA